MPMMMMMLLGPTIQLQTGLQTTVYRLQFILLAWPGPDWRLTFLVQVFGFPLLEIAFVKAKLSECRYRLGKGRISYHLTGRFCNGARGRVMMVLGGHHTVLLLLLLLYSSL